VVNHNTGKTRTGVEFVTLHARKGLDGAILGRRGTELINTHVKEILKFAHPEFTPIHWASKDILEWPNGAITYLFSAEKPENIRSINISYYWIDEAAFMEFIRPAHNNLKLATRIETEENPKHVLITSTPTSTPWVMECEQNPDYEIRRVSTYANRANLGVSYLADLVKDLEGTRIGRQELHGEVLRDVEGALWNDDMFNHLKITDAAEFVDLCESMDDIVVAVDPAGTANKRSDETGIIAVGVQHTDEDGNRMSVSKFYVLADGTIKGTPTEWARRVYDVARIVRARRIVAEKNFGADMVKQVLTDFAKLSPEEAESVDGDNMSDLIEEADARQSKETRAESTVGKYEQGRVTHVPNSTAYGDLSTLEKEQTTWVPRSRGGKAPSPNRIDAIVWAVRALEKAIKYEGAMAGSRTVQERTTPHQAGQPRPDWLGAAITLPDIPPSREREPRTIQAPMRPSRERTAAPAAAVADSKKWPAKPRLAKTGTTKRPAGVHRR
jgi:phage terminase large subunit-like protein